MKRATVTEVRPTRPQDGAFLCECAWVAVDSRGYSFAADTEREARELAEEYHHPRHTSRERGRVAHP